MQNDFESDRSHESWLRRHWRMAVIVIVASVVAFYSFRNFNWLAGISAIAIGLGVLMNVAAMLANSGRMPVETDDDIGEEPSHQTMGQRTRLQWLGDWIPCGQWMISLGDVVLFLGLLVFLVSRFL